MTWVVKLLGSVKRCFHVDFTAVKPPGSRRAWKIPIMQSCVIEGAVERRCMATLARTRLANAWVLSAGEEPPLAAHLVTPRRGYTHHGLYVGQGRIIHYAGLAGRLRRGVVEEI